MCCVEQKFRTVFATFGRALSCWKIASEMPWTKGTTSSCCISRMSLLLMRFPSIRSKLGRPWYEIALQTMTLDVLQLHRSLTHSEKAALSGISPYTNEAIMVPRIEAWLIWKRQLNANQLAWLCAPETIADATIDSFPWGGCCLKAHLNTVHSAADADELTKPMLVHL